MLIALAEHGPKSLKIHEGLLEMVKRPLVAVVVTLGRREQSPADGCWFECASADVGVHTAFGGDQAAPTPTGCLVLTFLCQETTTDIERR
jgi:hypothetical protein